MSTFQPHELARMVDANANRAREALRTMEDVARFRLGDGALCGRIKHLRHGLRGAVDDFGLGTSGLMAHRDTPRDVGTSIKASDEGERGGVLAMAIAAGKRAGEALRVLEECAKSSRGGWREIERLRYELYSAEKDLVLALGTGRARQWRLCVLVTESHCVRPWQEVVREAVLGGADCVQVREPGMSDGALLERVRAAMMVVDKAWMERGSVGHDHDEASLSHEPSPLPPSSGRESEGIAKPAVIVNNRVDVALAAGADGVHLGVDDLPIVEARRICGDALLIGASTHSLAEAHRAVEAGADMCGVGAMFASTTKVRAVSGAEYLRAYLADESLQCVPHLAIGGITPDNIREIRAIGCRGVAVSGVVCGSARPREVCERLLSGL